MSAITAKASRKMKKYAVLTREPRCFLGSFDFSWEQRKLGEMGQTYTGLSGKTKDDFGHGQARFVTYMNVFSNPISNPEMTEPIEIDPKQNEVEVGDVFFTTSSETPEEVGMSSILLEKRGKTYLNSFCFGFRPSEKIDSYYLAYMLRSESTRAKIILLAQGISRYNISKNKVMEIAVSLPSLDEQKLIGQYFSQLDNLITLHQRECISFTARAGRLILTANKKRSTSSWEQRKVGEVSESYSGGTPSVGVKEYYGGQIPFIRSAEINSEITELFLTEEGLKNSSARLVAVGDILYALYGATSGEVGRARLKGAINQAILAIKPHTDYDSEYLAQWLRKSKHSIIETYLQGGQGNLSGTIVKELSVDFPSLKEQKAIGDFFRQLDNLITLHQRKPFLMKWRTSDANRNQTNRLVL